MPVNITGDIDGLIQLLSIHYLVGEYIVHRYDTVLIVHDISWNNYSGTKANTVTQFFQIYGAYCASTVRGGMGNYGSDLASVMHTLYLAL